MLFPKKFRVYEDNDWSILKILANCLNVSICKLVVILIEFDIVSGKKRIIHFHTEPSKFTSRIKSFKNSRCLVVNSGLLSLDGLNILLFFKTFSGFDFKSSHVTISKVHGKNFESHLGFELI